jgi:hypothetical protein
MRPRYLFFTTLWLVAAVCAFAQSPETVLYSFLGDPVHIGDGRFPAGSILFDHSGNLYGVTAYGGPATALDSFCLTVIGCGTVYKLTHSQAGWSESRTMPAISTAPPSMAVDLPIPELCLSFPRPSVEAPGPKLCSGPLAALLETDPNPIKV